MMRGQFYMLDNDVDLFSVLDDADDERTLMSTMMMLMMMMSTMMTMLMSTLCLYVIAKGGNQKREAIRELSLAWPGACIHCEMHPVQKCIVVCNVICTSKCIQCKNV